MGRKEEVAALGRADRGDEVPDPGAADGAAAREAVAGEIVGDARIEADRAHLGDQALADGVVRGAVHRVRTLVAEDALKASGGAIGVERVGRGGGGRGGEGDEHVLHRHRREQQQDRAGQHQPVAHSSPSLRPRAAMPYRG